MRQRGSPRQLPDPAVVWKQVLAHLASQLNPRCLQTWFGPIRCQSCDQNQLHLTAPNETFKHRLLDHYADLLRAALRETLGAALEIQVSVEPAASPQPETFPVVRAAELEAPPSRQVAWLVESLWTASAVGILGGPPKCGKTWLALEIAVAVASGSPCLGTFPVLSRGPVLLYAAEDPPSALRLRLESLAQNRQLELDQLDLRVLTTESLRLDRAEHQDKLEATVVRHRPVLLVLDPLIRLHAIDENLAGEVSALLGYLRGLQRQTGVAILLVHHARKNVSPTPGATGYSLRGSSDLYAWVDSFLYLQHRRQQLTLSVEHRSAASLGPWALQLVECSPPGSGPHLKLLSPAEASSPPETDPLLPRILEILSQSPQPMTADKLRSSLQMRNQRVVEALRKLSSDGKVLRLAQGYSLNPTLAPR